LDVEIAGHCDYLFKLRLPKFTYLFNYTTFVEEVFDEQKFNTGQLTQRGAACLRDGSNIEIS